ncbi:unnamed protein product [Spirodela intermedia]|uniref:RING-type E3 ubiquitin transferase n=1 Tax=Spirodela intermedia TaxID=51605 RepID=A0A7I8J8N9_SPIIN|nr:unnamed protein product [Spirodela intermedia]CAA6666576.1 unnamed protein product [Spirodela intermedia]
MEGNRFQSSFNGDFSRSGSEGESTGGIEEIQTPLRAGSSSDNSQRDSPSRHLGEKVFVAVAKEFKESKSVLMWALQNFPRDKKIVLAHVHRHDQMIPMMGAKFPVSKLSGPQVAAHRKLEEDKMNKTLEEYLAICEAAKFRAERLVIKKDDVAKGLLTLIRREAITNLVMGAASDRNYSKKMRSLKSKKAKTVHEEAASWCRITFVCKGNLICVREAGLDDGNTEASSGSTSSQPGSVRGTLPERPQLPTREEAERLRSRSEDLRRRAIPVANPRAEPTRMAGEDSQRSDSSSRSANYEVNGPPSPSAPRIEESLILPSSSELEEGIPPLYPLDIQEDGITHDDLYDQVQQALAEAENAKREAYEEACRRQKAEKDALDRARRVITLANMHERESKQRRDAEAALASETQELEKLKTENLDAHQKLWEAGERRSALEAQVAQAETEIRILRQKLEEAELQIRSLQRDQQELRQERDDALREAAELSAELEQATCGFDDSLKIGEGGYGSVYRGVLRHTTVAIKRLHPQGTRARLNSAKSRMRHPNLVTLIGVCPEAWCLVYEFLSNGSLEDRLTCKDNSPPLPWQARTRIAADICSALIFLHSSAPHSVVHGDLKPANVLLDSTFSSKLGDFGLSRLLSHSSAFSSYTTLCHRTAPKGTIMYMDPEILVTGELTLGSDIYSLGVIILRLLTGRPAHRIVRDVEEALEGNTFRRMVDESAGDWPFVQANQLVNLAMQCCQMNHRDRPDLINGVWRVLEPMKNSASALPAPSLRLPSSDDDSHAPSYFLCPIFQEVMRDPQVAADGFTYEGEAVRGWFESKNTSPMTNLVLPHTQLIPNLTLGLPSRSGCNSDTFNGARPSYFFGCSAHNFWVITAINFNTGLR